MTMIWILEPLQQSSMLTDVTVGAISRAGKEYFPPVSFYAQWRGRPHRSESIANLPNYVQQWIYYFLAQW